MQFDPVTRHLGKIFDTPPIVHATSVELLALWTVVCWLIGATGEGRVQLRTIFAFCTRYAALRGWKRYIVALHYLPREVAATMSLACASSTS